jgi:replication factor C large subunit
MREKMSGDKGLFVEKYAAKSLKEFIGIEESILLLKRFVINFRKGKKACILHGASGTGKTSLVYSLAREMGFEIMELNASDFRTRKDVDGIMKKASEQKSLFSSSKIILIDELDGISGMKDRGGLGAVEDLILESQYPIFMTANDIWQKQFNKIRQKCELIQIREVNYNLIADFIERVCRCEKMLVNRDAIIRLAIKSKGDFRAVLNDLHVLCSGTNKITNEDVEKMNEREKDEGIFNSLQLVFKSNKIEPKILSAYENLNMELNEVFLWLDENIPKEYSGVELFKAYEFMSKTDIFKRRIMRQQHWRFLVYMNNFMTAGILVSKNQGKPAFTKYNRPARLLKIWIANRNKEYIKSISIKYARKTHCSIKRAVKEFEIIRIMLRNSRIMDNLNLNDNEKEFILNK